MMAELFFARELVIEGMGGFVVMVRSFRAVGKSKKRMGKMILRQQGESNQAMARSRSLCLSLKKSDKGSKEWRL